MQLPSTLGILAEGHATEKIPANTSSGKRTLTKARFRRPSTHVPNQGAVFESPDN